jgi:hypothetical protein
LRARRYTSNGLTSIESLKGTDRALAELVLAARHRMLKPAVVDLTGDSSDDDAAPPPPAYVSTPAPQFDAYLTLVNLWQEGEAGNPQHIFHTAGPLVAFTPDEKKTRPIKFKAALKADKTPFEDHDGVDCNCYEVESLTGNHSLTIEKAEFVISDERQGNLSEGWGLAPEKVEFVEFVGNGCPSMGGVFSRAAIVMWPTANRVAVEKQAIGASKNPIYGLTAADMGMDY